MEAGELSYPEDFPGTEGYGRYIEGVRRERIERYRKLPNNKRVKYSRINSPFPFGADFRLLCKSRPFE